MTTFLLIRHGHTDAIGKKLVGRTPGVPLTEEGVVQAERLAERLARLPIKALYSSPLERTRATAAPIARALSLEVSVDELLNEFEFGAWTNKNLDELHQLDEWRAFNQFRSGTPAPGGESMLEVQGRMVSAVQRLAQRHPGVTVALVSHGDPLRALLGYFLGAPLDLMTRIDVQPASVSVLELESWGARIVRLNDTGSLV